MSEIRCYSPTRAKLETFCRAMSEQTGVAVVPSPSPEAAVKGADIVLCGPASLLPRELKDICPGVTLTTNMNEAIKDASVIMMLRVQLERQHEAAFPAGEYFSSYGLRPEHVELARPDVIVMHPGPMNRGIEISTEVADGPRALIGNQVTLATYPLDYQKKITMVPVSASKH